MHPGNYTVVFALNNVVQNLRLGLNFRTVEAPTHQNTFKNTCTSNNKQVPNHGIYGLDQEQICILTKFQAPVAPKKRTSMRNRAVKAGVGIGAPIQQRTNAIIDDSFSSTKKDKRNIKHNIFLSRIEKVNQKDSKKRRRPTKKLVTTLESLADALPEFDDEDAEETVVGQAIIKRKSLKSRPGAMKRREKIEKMEKERFTKNMADMAGLANTNTNATVVEGHQAAAAPNPPASRWAALRTFIEATMEQKPEFVKKNTPAT